MSKVHLLVSRIKELADKMGKTPTKAQFLNTGVTEYSVVMAGGYTHLLNLAGFQSYHEELSKSPKSPKVLIFDIETAPLLAYVWGLFDQNVGLDQIYKDWHVLSWAAKWVGQKKMFYMDQRKSTELGDDSEIMKPIWSLLNEADIVITQNGIKFDVKKLNARFVHHGFPPPSSFRHIDTLRIARKHFALTSNKLEYMTNKFNKKYKKLKHKRFPGFELWAECLKGNSKAFTELEKYNKYDVLALEELYLGTLRKWDNSINFNTYCEEFTLRCDCGSTDFKDGGHKYTNLSKMPKIICTNCGKEHVIRENVLSKEKRKSLTK